MPSSKTRSHSAKISCIAKDQHTNLWPWAHNSQRAKSLELKIDKIRNWRAKKKKKKKMVCV